MQATRMPPETIESEQPSPKGKQQRAPSSCRQKTQAKAPAVVRHATSRQAAPSVARPTNVPNSVFALGKVLAKS